MKVLLAVLPSFQSRSFLIPHLGMACLKAYLKTNIQEITVNTIDLRIVKGTDDIWGPEDFPQITFKKTFVSDIYDLPLIASLIYKYKKYKSIKEIMEPELNVVSRWSLERSIYPEFIMDRLRKTHKFAMNYLMKFGGYDVVGFSLYTSNLYLSIFMALLIKLTYPETKIIFGGPQITQGETTRELLLRGEVADYLALGEGEQPFLELINALEAGESADNIIGLKTQTNIDKIDTFYQKANLEELPIPDYEGTLFESYRPKLISIYSNRGCPFRCHFCSEHSLFGKKFKRRSPEIVINDMKILNKKHNIYKFHFSDSLLNSSDEWLEEFISLLQNCDDKFIWEGFFRAEMSKELITKMKNVGLNAATLGVESFSQKILNKMNKKKDEPEILDTIHFLLENDIKTFINLFVGYPGENEEDFMETLEVANELFKEFKLKNKSEFFRMTTRNFQMRPFSNVYNSYKKFGLEADTWENFFTEEFFPAELKNVFEKTLYSFKVNDVPLVETHHRLFLINQIKRKIKNIG